MTEDEKKHRKAFAEAGHPQTRAEDLAGSNDLAESVRKLQAENLELRDRLAELETGADARRTAWLAGQQMGPLTLDQIEAYRRAAQPVPVSEIRMRELEGWRKILKWPW